MPRAPKNTAVAPANSFPADASIDENEDDLIDGDVIEDEELQGDVDRIRAMLDAAPESATVAIYSVPDKGPNVWLCEITPAEFSIDFIKQNYGGGKYRIRGTHKINGRKPLFINREIVIGESFQEKMLRENNARFSVNPAFGANPAPAVNGGFDLQGLAMLMQENTRQIIEAVKPQAVDAKKDLLETIALVKELMPQQRNSDPLDMVNKVFDMVGKVREVMPSENDNPLVTAMEKFAPPLLAAIQQGNNQQQNPAPQIAAPQSGAENVNMLQRAMIGQFLNQLLNAAQKGTSYEVYAQVVVDQVETMGTNAEEALVNFLDQENCVDLIIQQRPEAANFRSWFEGLKNKILENYPLEQEVGMTSQQPQTNAQQNTGQDLTAAPESGIPGAHVVSPHINRE